ncbi:uncharacterized protein LOC123263602 isoform X1 [Cotesia glomerata]|uniref:uncharacterized protein LOC123263602 isoform X1 n=1 Tax=Cotesia glomerata TaxID=32391 RepID=UPI001D00D3DF|nr:uncharacterized protein LOC123263602 isoform X1 [Cotesia glomerata]
MPRYSPSQLEVIINWQKTFETICDSRTISFFFYSPNFDENKIKPSDWVLLKLDKPFELYDRVGIIPLADKSYQWDPEDCFIYRWMPVKTKYKVESGYIIEEDCYFFRVSILGFLHREYRVSLTPGSSGLYDKEMGKLPDSLDCIIEFCYGTIDEEKIFTNISFVGSPIVCKLVDQDQYLQVGLTTFVGQWIAYPNEDHFDFEDITEYNEASFVDLTEDFDEYIVPTVLTD